MIYSGRIFSDIHDAIMARHRELLRMESSDVWTPRMDEEMANLRVFLDALDEGRVTIVARRP